MPFQLPQGAGRDSDGGGDGRPGNPGGGAHELQFDHQGNVIIGMDNGTVKYDPKTGKFTGWSAGDAMFGLDPDGNVWFMQKNGELSKIDTNSEDAEADDLPDSEEQGNLRHRHRFQGPDRSLHLARRQDRHLRSQDRRVRRVQDADADGRSAARADRRSGSPLGRRVLRRPGADVRSGQEGAQGIPADQRRPSPTRRLTRSPIRPAPTTRTRSSGRTTSAATVSIAST